MVKPYYEYLGNVHLHLQFAYTLTSVQQNVTDWNGQIAMQMERVHYTVSTLMFYLYEYVTGL